MDANTITLNMIIEAVLLLFVLSCVRVLFYAGQRLTKRPLEHKLIILLLYTIVFYVYFDINEAILKQELDEQFPIIQPAASVP